METRTALVTGGAKRVGRAICLNLAEAGFRVAFTYRSSRIEAESLVSSLAGGLAIAADLTEPTEAVREIAEAVEKQFGRLDVLVNNASIYQPGGWDSDEALWRKMSAIHVESPLRLCRRFFPLLEKAGGSVVNMLDIQVERPLPTYMAYCFSKAGLWNLTLSLARQLAPRVRVNGIAPGVVDWPDDLPAAARDAYLRNVPLGRAGEPKDVAQAARFLCAEGRYMTGQILRLDGGRSLV